VQQIDLGTISRVFIMSKLAMLKISAHAQDCLKNMNISMTPQIVEQLAEAVSLAESKAVDVDLNVGSPGSFTGITQFRSASTTAARSQDGYPMGKLSDIAIDEYGEIKGTYTNGVSKSIAKIYVADFNNPAGLLKTNDGMLAVSNNSGQAVMQQPGVGSSTKIKTGALEMSNVELATEFTNMITTQRAYQANARVITKSDELLQELVSLIR
jgi:flagellar hook protein FlgE